MAKRRTTESASKPEFIEEIAKKAEQAVLARAREEREQRIALSKTLGERAMNGEPFGMKGFMAIGFPGLNPESQEYRDIELACNRVKWIKPGTYIAVGDVSPVYGIKANAGNQGLAFSVSRGENGRFDVEAQVLCSRALYSHTEVHSAEMHGSDENPYGVYFIDTFHRKIPELVREIRLASETNDVGDRFKNGMLAGSDLHTERLAAEFATA